MNRPRLSLPVAVLVSVGLSSQEPARSGPEAFAELLERIPPQADIERYKAILHLRGASLTERGIELEREQAMKVMEQVKETIPKLKSMIKVGHSVFEYPGLLSRGRISYDALDRKNPYSMYIGVYLRGHEGSEPYDFEITFSPKGIINSVKPVVWKS